MSKQVECSEEMYQAFKAVAFAHAADAESMADAFKNALQVVIDMAVKDAREADAYDRRKPVFIKHYSGHAFGVTNNWLFSPLAYNFPTEDAAEKWALDNGFRVIEHE